MITTRQYAGGVLDEKEKNAAKAVIDKGWFGLGDKGEEFETSLAKFVGMRGSVLANSGSSANLLAMTSLELPEGSEVITCALGFPTTINPIIQNRLIPVFVDCDESLNIDYTKIEKALSDKTKAIIFAHTLGNPAYIEYIRDFATKHKLKLIEDTCDSLGSTFNGQTVGSFGDLSTYSFYPAHHITMGEGGAIAYRTELQRKILINYRDWGRDCWCRGDEKRSMGACQVRFRWKVDGHDYDHKYVISKIGYNLKPTEIEAAIGVEQLKKVKGFIETRKKNYQRMMKNLQGLEEFFSYPKVYQGSDPSWFAFPMTLHTKKFTRLQIMQHLEGLGIQTRLIFAGNIIRQPAYKKTVHRVVGTLNEADNVMFNSMMVGVYPGLSESDIDFISFAIRDYVKKFK